MSAWTLLLEKSSAPTGSTAWEHLISPLQSGGNGDVIIGGSLIANIDMSLTVDIGEVLSSNLLMDELSANILDDLSSEIQYDLGANI